MSDPYKGSVLVQIIGIASVLYGAADALMVLGVLTIIVLFAEPGASVGVSFEEWGRAPMAILLLAGGLGLLMGKPWSRYVYWVLPIYPLIVTLVLLPVLLGPASHADLGAVIYAVALTWPLLAAFLCVVAYIVTRHFRRLMTQASARVAQ